MKIFRFSINPRHFINGFEAVLSIVVTTIILYLIGRETLGEAVIALLYLVPVAWSTNRWGQWPGIAASLAAALAFDYLFIPPYYTFVIGRLEGWLVLVIFLVVAVVVVGRIQDSLNNAHEAVFLYELTSDLSGQRTPQAVAITATRHIQQWFQADLVKVVFIPGSSSENIIVKAPIDVVAKEKPDRVLPLINSRGLVGEIHIWGNFLVQLPPTESRFLNALTRQIALAFDRTQQASM
jgi:K+-sensing histidine kinase KdpD